MEKFLLIPFAVTLFAAQSFSQSSNGPEIQVHPDTLFFEFTNSVDSLLVTNHGNSDLQIDSLERMKPMVGPFSSSIRIQFFIGTLSNMKNQSSS